MTEPQFKQYQPGIATYARRRTAHEWDQYRQLLTDLHNQQVSRRLMLEELAKHDFQPTVGQMVTQMRKWGLMVHATSCGRNLTDSESVPADSDEPVLKSSVSQEEAILDKGNIQDLVILLPAADTLNGQVAQNTRTPQQDTHETTLHTETDDSVLRNPANTSQSTSTKASSSSAPTLLGGGLTDPLVQQRLVARMQAAASGDWCSPLSFTCIMPRILSSLKAFQAIQGPISVTPSTM